MSEAIHRNAPHEPGYANSEHRPDNGSVPAVTLQLYDELRRLARSKLRTERSDHTLDTSALVSEAWVKLSGETRVEWKSRSHFMAAAAVAMRRILMDYAKGRHAAKRGGPDAVHVTFQPGAVAAQPTGAEPVDLLQLETSLNRLAGFQSPWRGSGGVPFLRGPDPRGDRRGHGRLGADGPPLLGGGPGLARQRNGLKRRGTDRPA